MTCIAELALCVFTLPQLNLLRPGEYFSIRGEPQELTELKQRINATPDIVSIVEDKILKVWRIKVE